MTNFLGWHPRAYLQSLKNWHFILLSQKICKSINIRILWIWWHLCKVHCSNTINL